MLEGKSKKLQSARNRLKGKGLTVPQWANESGFNVRAVRAVLYGHNEGNYGKSHDIAVALGLKNPDK